MVSAVHAGVQWRPAIGGYQVGNVHPSGKTYLFSSAECEVRTTPPGVEPQPQIISMRTIGKPYSGVEYSVAAGSETWRYISSAQDTEATILNGLA